VTPFLALVSSARRRSERIILHGDEAGQRQRAQQPEQATARRLGAEGASETIKRESIH
jgi:hypothetical protein